jgi:hypothetical protein
MHRPTNLSRRVLVWTVGPACALLTCACVQSSSNPGGGAYFNQPSYDGGAAQGAVDSGATTDSNGRAADAASGGGAAGHDVSERLPNDAGTSLDSAGRAADDGGSAIVQDAATGTGGIKDGQTKPPKICNGFATGATKWAVPDSVFDVVAWYWSPLTWTIMDINGDGKIELVHTEDPDHKGHPFGGKSTPVWHVFTNTASGFSAKGQPWPVPSDLFHAPFFSQLELAWSTVDINHDGRPDLLQTEDPDNKGHAFGGASDPHWRLYVNTGKAFAKTHQKWHVPAPVFDALAYGSYELSWVTMDLDGDGWKDLVHTEDPDKAGHAFGVKQGQAPHWRVYKGAAGGFAAKPVLWAVPDGVFDSTALSLSELTWTTMDMTGDGRPDLVQTEDPKHEGLAFGGKSDPHWRLYVNTGGGFAKTAKKWAVPDGMFEMPAVAIGQYTWSTIDLNRDGRPDLVHTENPDKSGRSFGGATTPHWRVYLGGTAGFAKTAKKWAVGDENFDAMWWHGTDDAWGTFDLDGDGCLDFVRTRDPQSKSKAFGGAAAPHWRTFLGI